MKIDDGLKASPQLNRYRPDIGIVPKITDAELITVAVLQVVLGHDNETRWLRRARKDIGHLFPYLPKQPGYNKRLRTLVPQLAYGIAVLAADTDLWHHPIRIADSTPVQSGASRTTAQNSDLAGWTGYGYCGLILVVDKGYHDHTTETWLNEAAITIIRPAYRNETPRPGRALLHAVRQTIDQSTTPSKDQLGLEHHGGRTTAGVTVRILQRILTLTSTIWHKTGTPSITG